MKMNNTKATTYITKQFKMIKKKLIQNNRNKTIIKIS